MQTWERHGITYVPTHNYDGTCNLHICFTYDVNVLCRIGPEKGVIHIALGAVDNALWDMYARSRNKPLWKLVVDFTPVRFFCYCSTLSYDRFCRKNS